jgi:hypothetical protein
LSQLGHTKEIDNLSLHIARGGKAETADCEPFVKVFTNGKFGEYFKMKSMCF